MPNIFEALGLRPVKSSKAKGAETATMVKPGSAQATAMANDATKYAAAKQAALDQLATLTEPSAASEKQKIENDLVVAATAKAQAGDFAGGMTLLGQVAGRVAAAKKAAAAAFAEYDQKRAAAQALLDALRAHPQQAKVATQIADAAAKLAGAKIFADKGEYGPAKLRVEDARVICVAAKTLADRHAVVAKKRADAVAIVNGGRGLLPAAEVTQWDADLNTADTDIAATPPKLDAAAALLDGIVQGTGARIKDWYSVQSKERLKQLKAKAAAAFVDAAIKDIEAQQAIAVAAIGAKEWGKAVMAGNEMFGRFAQAERAADRRLVYDKQRPLTVNAITPLRPRAALATLVAGLDKALVDADALATLAAMKIEDGVQALLAIVAKCDAAGKIGDAAEAYARERAAVDKDLATLQADPAAAKMKPTIDAIVAQLAKATQTAAAAAGAEDALAKWEAARALVAAAAADTAAAKKLSAGVGSAMQAGAAAAGAKDIAALKKALASLKSEGDAAQKAPGADAAADAFKAFAAALKLAQAAADGNDLKGGTEQAGKAADLLVAAKAVQAQHGDYAALRKTIEERRKKVGVLPVAASLAALLAAIDNALIDAATRDAGHDAAAAMAALRTAAAAATHAEQAAVARKAYDDRAKTIDTAIKAIAAPADRALRDALAADLVAATHNADAVHFTIANQALEKIEVKLEGKKAGDLAKTSPNSAALKDAVKKMMAKGGDTEVDALMSSLPDNVDTKVLVTLAKERFGVDLVVDGTAPDEAKTIKQMCRMLAKVPHDVKKSPSLKTVKHEKPNTNGGAYGGDDGGVITMNGRPKQSDQEFGSKQINADGTPELPDGVDPDCQPKDEEKIDYFDFATLHEVGHSVDDAQNFMKAREDNAEFGGWRTYGGNVQPIADAVAAEHGFDKTPEQKKYVIDLILRKMPVPPAAPPGQEVDFQTRLNSVNQWHLIATAQNVWWRQGDCDTITIGDRIYHEAYDQTWVSYLAGARKRGITGYQFRAPAEWFAELYATFHMDKLKPSHPARSWLAKLGPPTH